MSQSAEARVAAAVLVSLLAVACSGGSDLAPQPPSVDVSGDWNGDWSAIPVQNTAAGELSLILAQDAAGVVTGSAAISNIGCGSGLTFQGALVDRYLIGTATNAPDVQVQFEIDCRQANLGAAGTIVGTFAVRHGAGCPPPFEAEFLMVGTPPTPPVR